MSVKVEPRHVERAQEWVDQTQQWRTDLTELAEAVAALIAEVEADGKRAEFERIYCSANLDAIALRVDQEGYDRGRREERERAERIVREEIVALRRLSKPEA